MELLGCKKRKFEAEISLESAKKKMRKQDILYRQALLEADEKKTELLECKKRKRETDMSLDVVQKKMREQDSNTPVGIAKLLELSPGSSDRVQLMSSRVRTQICHTLSSVSDAKGPWYRNHFIYNAVQSLTPVVEHLCKKFKFQGNTDVQGLVQLIAQNVIKKNDGGKLKCRRRLLVDPSDGPSDDIANFLQEMGKSWRAAMRENDRGFASRILQVSLRSIPERRSGRVRDWLPKYFNEDVDLIPFCHVRILGLNDPASFRNRYRRSKVITGQVTLIGESDVEVIVKEDFGLQVVVNNDDGTERVLNLIELKRCELNPHKVNNPRGAALHHKWNKTQARRIQTGSLVEHLDASGKKWVQSRVVRVVKGNNIRFMVYTVPREKVVHVDSVRLTEKVIKLASSRNKLWGARLTPSVRFTERHIVSPQTYEHLRDYVFSPEFIEPLKASEQSIRLGHCFAIREAITASYPRYCKHAEEKGVSPVSLRVYKRVLSSKVFTRYRKDHCMCKTCLRSG